MTELELQLIPTEKLTEEFCKRFDAVIIYGIQKGVKGTISNYYDHYVGDQATLIGLCRLLEDKIKEDYKNNTVDEGGQDA